jgi:hypothetical protein
VAELITDAEVHAVMAANEQVLDLLVDSYRQFLESDRASGATDEYGALGGICMLAERAIELGPVTLPTLVGIAVRRLAKEETPDA